MKRDLIPLLRCPVCGADLDLESSSAVFDIDDDEHIEVGTIACRNQHRFPVLDEVPRLVPPQLFSADERRALDKVAPALVRRRAPLVVDEATAEERIRSTVEKRYDPSSPASKARGRLHATYMVAEYRGEGKRKYARLLSSLGLSPTTILDVGGSLPGLVRCLADEFQPRLAVVADLEIDHADVFKSADRRIALVRADAQRLPFKRAAFDLVVSAFLLEHVPAWQSAVEAMADAGKDLFVAYGPNRWFPFELGHLNAPLAGTLPRPLAKYAAYAWLRLRGQSRPLRAIESLLQGMSYISSWEFRRHCRGLGLDATNVFRMVVAEITNDDGAPATRPRRLVRSFPRLARGIAGILEVMGLEPQVYHVLRHQDSADA